MQTRIETQADGQIVIQPNGALDREMLTEFLNVCAPYSQMSGARLVLDMSHVVYVSNEGLHALTDLQARLAANGGALAVFGVGAFVYKVFEMTGAARTLRIFETRVQALGSAGA